MFLSIAGFRSFRVLDGGLVGRSTSFSFSDVRNNFFRFGAPSHLFYEKIAAPFIKKCEIFLSIGIKSISMTQFFILDLNIWKFCYY